MNLKKCLVSVNKDSKGQAIQLRSGQAVIEYVVIFIAIALLAGGFISRAKGVLGSHFNNTVSRILN